MFYVQNHTRIQLDLNINRIILLLTYIFGSILKTKEEKFIYFILKITTINNSINNIILQILKKKRKIKNQSINRIKLELNPKNI